MPCGYHMNLEDGLVTINGAEELDMGAFVDLGEQVLSDPTFDPYLPQLVDLRGLQVGPDHVGATHLRDFIVTIYRPRVQSSIAVVIDGSLHERAVAGLYHLCCAMDATELFDQYDQALKWLMRREFV